MRIKKISINGYSNPRCLICKNELKEKTAYFTQYNNLRHYESNHLICKNCSKNN